MTRSVTLTTVVCNPETLPYLLKVTDGLVEAGLLTELRVVDEAGGHDGTTKLRELLSTDAALGTRIVVVDLEKVRARDPQSYFATGASDYRHRSALGTLDRPSLCGLPELERKRSHVSG